MRTLLERHAETMSPRERGLVWERVAMHEKPVRAVVVSRTAAIAASFAVAAIVLALLPREIAFVRRPVSVEARREPVVSPEPVTPVSPRSVPTPSRSVPRAAIHAAPLPAVPPSIAAPSVVPAPSLRQPPATATGPGVLSGRIVDEQNQPVPYASVRIREMRRGALTDEDGRWRVEGLPLATYSVEVRAIGRPAEVREGLAVDGKTPTIADVQMREAPVVTQIEELQVAAPRRIDTKSSTTKQTITAQKLRELPVDNLKEAIGVKSGVVASGGELHFRGGRGDEVEFQFDGGGAALGAPAVTTRITPPVVPTTGGTRLPNDEPFDSMFFKNYGVNPFVPADEDPLSTFAVDVDAASFTLARRYLELDQMPPADAVRVEEFVNWLPQGYRGPEHDDFAIAIDGAPSPFGPGYRLLRVGLAARVVDPRDRRPAQLTFVIDISGSMEREERLGLVKRALRLLVDQLRRDDQVGIVVYGSTGRVLLEPAPVGDDPVADAGDDDEPAAVPASFGAGRRRILQAIEQLQPDGSTNAEEGLRLGYEMARRAYRPRALNRILLCSDGVANVGLTGPESILAQVKTDADRGISLTTIGFGMGNYNDVLMEQLADRGDGNHYYVDEIGEARRVFVENLTGTLQTLARDAKVQVEFVSTRVLRYRLLGFENRDVADRDFRNDRVDAGEIGAGHTVTALYEVKLARDVTAGTLATVRLRWASPEHAGSGAPKVREIEQKFDARSLARRFDDADPHFRLDAATAEFAEILRGSYWAKESRFTDVLPAARRAARDLRDESSATVLAMIEKAARLKGAKGTGGER